MPDTAPPPRPRPRRTQQQRREHTINRLVDATVRGLAELGYARCSVQEICVRAGVSQGALFRHFPTRRALLVTTAERVAARQVADLREQLTGLDLDLREALLLLRAHTRSHPNRVWHELLQAARTDPELREQVAPTLRSHNRRVAAVASAFVGDRFGDQATLFAVMRLVTGYLDGEARVADVAPDPDRDDATLEFLLDLLREVEGGRLPGRPRTETASEREPSAH